MERNLSIGFYLNCMGKIGRSWNSAADSSGRFQILMLWQWIGLVKSPVRSQLMHMDGSSSFCEILPTVQAPGFLLLCYMPFQRFDRGAYNIVLSLFCCCQLWICFIFDCFILFGQVWSLTYECLINVYSNAMVSTYKSGSL